MSDQVARYYETMADNRVGAIPLGHLSIELGHLYMEDFAAGPRRLKELFDQVAPWAASARQATELALSPKSARVSTCFLVDDYFTQFSSPRETVPQLIDAAGSVGLTIDYLARESACVIADDIPLARLVEGRLVADPPPGTTGGRPPPSESGWLCNGVRSPAPGRAEAMRPPARWEPPSENGANRHSIFVDVQLWDGTDDSRLWSCPFLAAVWQLLRLGLIRDKGSPVAQPVPLVDLPDRWDELPPIVQLSPRPAPFAAYRTFSVLSQRFLPIEVAVNTILAQYSVERAVADQTRQRAAAEGLVLPPAAVNRIEYAFTGPAWR